MKPAVSITPLTPSAAQRGVASVALTGLLVLAMGLGVAFLSGHVLTEQRGATTQAHASEAFEAAEAGLEWATAQLNDPRPIDDACQPAADAAAGSFRTRFLQVDETTGVLTPTTRLQDATPVPLEAACVRDEDVWRCRCATSPTVPTVPSPASASAEGAALSQAFVVRFLPGGAPGVIRVEARGCAPVGTACGPDGAAAEATARVQVLLGWLPAVQTAPVAALTVRGDLVTDAALRVGNPTPASAGLTVHAGGTIEAPNAHWDSPAGTPRAFATVSDDPVLATTPSARWFVGHFGLDPDAWSTQPAVRHVACHGDCTALLERATAGAEGPSMLHVSGDASITGPARLGSAERPVVLVVTGALRIEGPVAIVGLAHAGSVTWRAGSSPAPAPADALPTESDEGAGTAGPTGPTGPAGPAETTGSTDPTESTKPMKPSLRGALVSASTYGGDAAPFLTHDADVLDRLRLHAGTFARVSGSWKDF